MSSPGSPNLACACVDATAPFDARLAASGALRNLSRRRLLALAVALPSALSLLPADLALLFASRLFTPNELDGFNIVSPRKMTTSASMHRSSLRLLVCNTSFTQRPFKFSLAAARTPRLASNTALKSSAQVDVPIGRDHLCKLYRQTVNASSPNSKFVPIALPLACKSSYHPGLCAHSRNGFLPTACASSTCTLIATKSSTVRARSNACAFRSNSASSGSSNSTRALACARLPSAPTSSTSTPPPQIVAVVSSTSHGNARSASSLNTSLARGATPTRRVRTVVVAIDAALRTNVTAADIIIALSMTLIAISVSASLYFRVFVPRLDRRRSSSTPIAPLSPRSGDSARCDALGRSSSSSRARRARTPSRGARSACAMTPACAGTDFSVGTARRPGRRSGLAERRRAEKCGRRYDTRCELNKTMSTRDGWITGTWRWSGRRPSRRTRAGDRAPAVWWLRRPWRSSLT